MTFNWHTKHKNESTIGDRMADSVAAGMGSWKFIIIQTIIVIIWMVLNTVGFIYHWDIYPFILLNLVFSTQAAYAAPIIMMAQNRAADRDRIQAENDYETNRESERRIEALQEQLADIEVAITSRRIQELQNQVTQSEKDRSDTLEEILKLLRARQ